MDILKWLDETEQPQVSEGTCKRKHSRKQPKSDSSLLEPLSLQVTSVQKGSTDQNAGEVPIPSPSDGSSSNRYARKSRRKTRSERYDPNAPKRSRQNSKHSKARQKSRQKKGQGPGQLVQSYKAQNVSGDRLTLRPPELGLFNKGRTSTAARGRGLPDLFFSEMKFLQRHDESRPPPQSEVSKTRHKKDHSHTKDEEILSFFTLGYQTLRRDSEDKHSRHSSVGKAKRRRCDRTPRTRTVMPTVELSDWEPCLRSESRQTHHESISYASWPKSVRARSTTPVRVQSGHDRHDSGRHGHPKPDINIDQSLLKRPVLPPVARQTTGSANGRFQVSPITSSHSRISRSQSCPQYSSSPRRVNLVDRSEKLQRTVKACLSSSMPRTMPQILNVNPDQGLSASRSNNAESRTPPDLEREAHTVSQRQRLHRGHKGYAGDLETSSDFGRVLQVCKESIHDRHLAASSRRQNTYELEFSSPTQSVRRQHRIDSHTSTQRIPIVRFAELPCRYPAQPTFVGPSIYEQQERRQCTTREVPGTENLDGDPRALEEEYMDENRALYYDDYDHDWDSMDDMVEASMLQGLEDKDEMCMDGSAFPVENVHEGPRPGNNVVAPGFWRPNKLY